MRNRVFFLFLCLPFGLLSQNMEEEIRPLKSIVKLPLFDMVDPFGPVFGLGFEQKIAKRVTLYAEGGYLSSFNGKYMLRRDLEGYKVRGEIRIYDRDDFCVEGISYGLQFMYKSDHANENGDFQRGGGAFFQNFDFQIERNVMALHFVTNIIFPLQGKSILEFSAWGGARRLDRKYNGIPDDAVLISDFGLFVSRDPGLFINPSLGFSIRMGLGW